MIENDSQQINETQSQHSVNNSVEKVNGREILRMPNGSYIIPGGKPGNRGGGRKPNWFKAELERILDHSKAVEVVGKIISGDILEKIGVDDDGAPIYGETRNADRLAAIKFASEHVVGKPVEHIQVEDITIRVTTE